MLQRLSYLWRGKNDVWMHLLCTALLTEPSSWIKTNFLWMMFRSGWGSKHNQEHILAIWLKLSAFQSYLENARTKGSVRDFKGTVRLQWDPDHDHNGHPHIARRAVQLGLKNVPTFIDGTDILCIQDISTFVHTQHAIAKKKKGELSLLVAKERVYTPTSPLAIKAMNLSPHSWGQTHLT